MKLALIQSKQNPLYDFPAETTFIEQEARSLRRDMFHAVCRSIETAARHGADLIVTTEAINFSGPFFRVRTPYHQLYDCCSRPEETLLSEIASRYHTRILAGLIRLEEDGCLYNSTVYFDTDGHIADIYHKIHLAGDESSVFTPGDALHTLDTEFGRLGFAVCWDMQFPETARGLAKMEADLILCPTWGWEWIYGPARAYENGVYVAAAMAVPYWMPIQDLRSPSQVIAPDGRILAEGSRTDSDIVYCDLADLNCRASRDFRLSAIAL